MFLPAHDAFPGRVEMGERSSFGNAGVSVLRAVCEQDICVFGQNQNQHPTCFRWVKIMVDNTAVVAYLNHQGGAKESKHDVSLASSHEMGSK